MVSRLMGSLPWKSICLGAGLVATTCLGATWLVVTDSAPLLDAPDFGSLGGDFTLTSVRGPFSTRSLRGKAVLVSFGYTYCPDVCPTTLSDVASALRRLSAADAARVSVLFVSVDPDRDSPERLAEYGTYFHPAIVGLTGSAPELARVARSFGVSFSRQPLEGQSEGYAMEHSGSLFVVDARGQLSSIVHHGATVDELERTLKRVLAH